MSNSLKALSFNSVIKIIHLLSLSIKETNKISVFELQFFCVRIFHGVKRSERIPALNIFVFTRRS